MSRLTKGIRNKRFRVKEVGSVKLHLQSLSGEHLEFDLVDCSLTGLAAMGPLHTPLTLEVSQILDSSKITWPEGEAYLGRLAVRRAETKDLSANLGFSSVDGRIPVSGKLSKYLDVSLNGADSAYDYELSSDAFNLAHFVENEYTNVDLFNRIDEFIIYYDEWAKSDRFGYRNIRKQSMGHRINLERKRKKDRSDYIMMASNDYLGLASHPEVMEAAKAAIDKYGFGSTGSPVTTGQTDLHEALCRQISSLHGREATLLYNSGYAANVGIIPSITAPNDLIIADALCHASIQDAMQMSRGTARFFKHNSIEHLEKTLLRERNNFGGALVVTEGVFSMDGDVAKLDEIYRVAKKYNARVMVDQAHCLGVLGPNGMGVCDKYNLLKEADIIMGTFSKIAGGIGGFVTGSRALIEWMRSLSRSQLFSVSLTPSTVAGVSKSLEIFSTHPELREQLKKNIAHFVSGMRDLGCPLDPNHESAVVPAVIKDEKKLGKIYQSLLDDGVVVIPIVYPAVSRNNCRLRFTLMATHELSDIDYVLMSFEKAMDRADFKFSRIEPDSDTKRSA